MLLKQVARCSLCRTSLSSPTDACLDHCHVSGNIREVLCRNCNGIEGKIFNLARRAKRDATPEWWLSRLLAYWLKHIEKPSGVYHPLHKTTDENRIIRNTKARKKRASKK